MGEEIGNPREKWGRFAPLIRLLSEGSIAAAGSPVRIKLGEQAPPHLPAIRAKVGNGETHGTP